MKKCEYCGNEKARWFEYDPKRKEWFFVGKCEQRSGYDYSIPRTHHQIFRVIAHLSEKTWFDGHRFVDMLDRFFKE